MYINNLDTYVCIIHAKMNMSGLHPRNLNDIKFRFANRTKEYTSDGRVYNIWGYFQRYNGNVYVRNDVLNDDGGAVNGGFKVTFSHELFHALSYKYGIYNQHKGNKGSVEEAMAEQFTDSMGLGR